MKLKKRRNKQYIIIKCIIYKTLHVLKLQKSFKSELKDFIVKIYFEKYDDDSWKYFIHRQKEGDYYSKNLLVLNISSYSDWSKPVLRRKILRTQEIMTLIQS